MLIPSEIDRKFDRRALKATEALTPAHAAAQAGMDPDGDEGPDEAERRRERVQHLADPVDGYLHEAPDVDKVDLAELEKAYRDAFDAPSGYPAMRRVDAEQFRQGPVTAGRPVPVPSAALSAGMITRPALGDGRSRPSAPGAC